MRMNPHGENQKFVSIKDGSLWENINLDFGGLGYDLMTMIEPSIHRGLLVVVHDCLTCHVYNPATKEVSVLPRSPALEAKPEGNRVSSTGRQAAIINLTDSLLPSPTKHTSFRVVRFSKSRGLVEVYSCDKQEWVQSKFSLRRSVISVHWYVSRAVFLGDTLFCLTCSERYAVVVKFQSSSCEQACVYCIRLPRRMRFGKGNAVLGVSQGCLCLSYCNLYNLWIWKYTGSSMGTDVWIPQLRFNALEPALCFPPVGKECILRFMREHSFAEPIAFHPNSSIIFVCDKGFIYGFDLIKDTVEKIAGFTKRENLTMLVALPYTLCFTSFKCAKLASRPC